MCDLMELLSRNLPKGAEENHEKYHFKSVEVRTGDPTNISPKRYL
jgi:hypothetical protein